MSDHHTGFLKLVRQLELKNKLKKKDFKFNEQILPKHLSNSWKSNESPF